MIEVIIFSTKVCFYRSTSIWIKKCNLITNDERMRWNYRDWWRATMWWTEEPTEAARKRRTVAPRRRRRRPLWPWPTPIDAVSCCDGSRRPSHSPNRPMACLLTSRWTCVRICEDAISNWNDKSIRVITLAIVIINNK